LQQRLLAEKVSVVAKNYVCRPEIGPKYFDKFKPEPGPTYNSGQKTKWRLPSQVYSVMEVRKVLMRFRCSRPSSTKNSIL